ncbi:VCBS repeat-containing protein [Marinoscillum sp. MHG1-6]|uniref:VCBS repeat-containing protein n=1 Tax=Marinoscillum sp. MHG1-6 TaxID=2959627 RepID=UPI00215809EF|nr:VCBS repeat-containing protein [Marinoscillum sp. MHG1-6]
MSPEQTGVDFVNQLDLQEGLDVFRYRNYYNGGGVGIGDINQDGLPDIYMVSNLSSNKLFLNLGDFTFRDITDEAGVGGNKPWSTGVAMADINGDGLLDIYVCNSGDVDGGNRGNELFINQGDGSFSEEAGAYGLSDQGFSTHAAFFDFDQDGDLDCYLLNNSFRPVSSLPIENIRDQRDELGGDKFYKNESGKFVDVSEEVGVYGSVIGFGLGITLLDVNKDSWTDIYVSNDFFERDYLYLNKGGSRFEEVLEDYFGQTSLFSMGADAADLNNDGLEEVFVTDMLPRDPQRLKQTTRFESYDLFNLKKSRGFHNQFMKNTLQLNSGNGWFEEVGQQFGVSATDWSWGALIFDMDNDGYKDIFVANGIYKDVTDQDFLKYFSSDENLEAARKGEEVKFEDFNERMPSNPLSNVVFSLDSTSRYMDKSEAWGLSEPSYSNGAAYADLDLDGDLDLVVNNVNQQAFIYRNESDQLSNNHFLRLGLKGDVKNKFAIGAEVKLYLGDEIISYQHYPTKGFQSSMDYTISLGLGNRVVIDSLEILWSESRRTILSNPPIDTTLQFSINDSKSYMVPPGSKDPIFTKKPFDHPHIENHFIDFDYNRLLYHQLSMDGPCLAVADLNTDGLDDFFIGGAAGYPGSIYLNNGNDGFRSVSIQLLIDDADFEDVDAVFFDADLDGDDDLLVVSGGVENGDNSILFKHRYYINQSDNGKLSFTRGELPVKAFSGSCIRVADYDDDNDPDIFIGARSIPGRYGIAPSSYLLENDGQGHFSDVTPQRISSLSQLGMVTDATWLDYDEDGDQDLFIVGDWMPLTLFENRGDFFQQRADFGASQNSKGWWRSLMVADIDQDGHKDLVGGNWGTNSMFTASSASPIRLYINDFDENGSLDHISCFWQDGKYYPYHLRDDLLSQLVFLKKKFPSFASYRDQPIEQIFSPEQLEKCLVLEVQELRSGVFLNSGDGDFRFEPLPQRAQIAPIFSMLLEDFNKDEEDEIMVVGNFFGTRPEEGIYDGNHGQVYSVEGQGLREVSFDQTGLFLKGQVREIKIAQGKHSRLMLVGRNNDQMEIYAY